MDKLNEALICAVSMPNPESRIYWFISCDMGLGGPYLLAMDGDGNDRTSEVEAVCRMKPDTTAEDIFNALERTIGAIRIPFQQLPEYVKFRGMQEAMLSAAEAFYYSRTLAGTVADMQMEFESGWGCPRA